METILAIIGPSAAGKSTVAERLQQRGLIHLNPIITERPRRPGEDDLNHTFVSGPEFDRRQKEGLILESVRPFGLDYRYGLESINFAAGRIASLILRADFLDLLGRHYPNQTVYQIEAPQEVAAQRLKARQTGDIGRRLKDYQREVDLGRQLAQRVFVNDRAEIESLVEEVAGALESDFPGV